MCILTSHLSHLQVLELDQEMLKLAEQLKDATSLLMFARGFNYATALEAALKVGGFPLLKCGINGGLTCSMTMSSDHWAVSDPEYMFFACIPPWRCAQECTKVACISYAGLLCYCLRLHALVNAAARLSAIVLRSEA